MKYRVVTYNRIAVDVGFIWLMVSAFSFVADAGDKLKIGGAKTRIQPGQEVKSAETLNSLRGFSGPGLPYDTMMLNPSRRRGSQGDPRLERKRQHEQDERENWALLAPGELQQEEEYDFGVREYRLEDIEKHEESRDYTFYGLSKDRVQEEGPDPVDSSNQSNRGLRPGTLYNPSQQQPSNQQRRAQEEEDQDRVRRNLNPNPFRAQETGQGNQRLGAHLSKELDLQGLLRTDSSGLGIGSTLAEDPTQPSLRSILGGGGSAVNSEDYNQRMNSFREMIDSGARNRLVGGLADPINTTPDLTRQPLNPSVASPSFAAPSSLNRQIQDRALGTPNSTAGRNPFAPANVPSFGEPTAPGFGSFSNPGFTPPNLRRPSVNPDPALPGPKRKL